LDLGSQPGKGALLLKDPKCSEPENPTVPVAEETSEQEVAETAIGVGEVPSHTTAPMMPPVVLPSCILPRSFLRSVFPFSPGRSHTKSPKTPTLPSAYRLVWLEPEPPFTVCSQLRRLLQPSSGKCPSSTHPPAPKPSCLQSETSFNLISEKCDILSILRDHPENRIYQRKIQELSKRFTSIRKTKGDGNCFYRALGYAYLESLLGKSREVLKFKERVLQTPNDLLAAGFEEHKFRNFFNAEVEPMAMECDHVQITALSQALNIALQVEYVDEMDTALNHHVFPEAAIPSVYLLYKTSHYNILYAAEKH
ncbi:hypothetical protein STEG23_019764, partial [Scotinomys teguina]